MSEEQARRASGGVRTANEAGDESDANHQNEGAMR